MMLNQNELRKRTINFRNALDLPVTRFLKHVNLSRSGYYLWIAGDYELSEQRATVIDDFLKRFGF